MNNNNDKNNNDKICDLQKGFKEFETLLSQNIDKSLEAQLKLEKEHSKIYEKIIKKTVKEFEQWNYNVSDIL